jgi:hypothetical protein
VLSPSAKYFSGRIIEQRIGDAIYVAGTLMVSTCAVCALVEATNPVSKTANKIANNRNFIFL